MRFIALVPNPTNEIRRVMVYPASDGTYLFLFRMTEDGPSFADHWFDSSAEAITSAEESFGIQACDWQMISSPLPGCPDDRVTPTTNAVTE
ncbi:hypothetical protein [Limnoglobus roseus]|uniref:hypothetical protein n=1 Tax=Limnoglobus roseus TaxID=2598579 RepID=UPI00143D01EB|nr:hypothetical protein [Limnoglobus roseus]